MKNGVMPYGKMVLQFNQIHSFSITLATSPPQRVQISRSISIPFSILLVTFLTPENGIKS
jgi:hypothetical protein